MAQPPPTPSVPPAAQAAVGAAPNPSAPAFTTAVPAAISKATAPPVPVSENKPAAKPAPPKPVKSGRTAEEEEQVQRAMEMTGMPALEDVLAMLSSGSVLTFQPKSAANVVTASDERISELSGDGVNDERFGYPAHRTVAHNPPVPNFVPTVQPSNVTHVPVSRPEASNAFNASVPVVKNTVFTDNSKRDLHSLERGAGQDSRRAGNFAAMVLSVIGVDEADASSAPIQGLLTRVAIAVLSEQTGAVPAPCPNVPGWDVRVTALSTAASAIERRPDHAPIFVPSDMPQQAAEALVSVCLPGGAAAYGWRFRDDPGGAADPRAGTMPSYVRKLYPGGTARILVVTEHPRDNWVFGGAALNRTRLSALERWLRGRYGHELMDQAFKTAAALGHVYVEPVPINAQLGEGFTAVRATTLHAGRALAGPDYHWTPGLGGSIEGRARNRQPELDLRARPSTFDDELYGAIRALNGTSGGGDANPPQTGRPIVHEGRREVWTHWRGNGGRQMKCWISLEDALAWLVDPGNACADATVDFAVSWIGSLDDGLYTSYDGRDRDKSDVILSGFRNSYGFADTCTFALPCFDFRAVCPAIAGVHIVNVKFGYQSSLDAFNRRDRLRHYVSKLHVAHLLAAAGKNMWPDLLDDDGVEHHRLATGLPRGLQPMTYLSDGGRDKLAAPNWQMLEPIHRLKGTNKKTAYFSYDVTGTWQVDSRGYVALNTAASSFPAVEAALRQTWNFGGTVDTVSRTQTDFVAVCDHNMLVAPLAVAPVVKAGRRTVGVEVAPGNGADMLGHGSNAAIDFVMAR